MRMTLFAIVFVLLTVLFPVRSYAMARYHPIHVSVVNLDLSSEKPIVFSVKLFKDDFAKIINRINQTHIEFTNDTKLENVEPYVLSYIEKNLVINNLQNYRLTRMEVSDLAVWFYFEIQHKNSNFVNFKIKNTLMCDLYHDQTNLFIMNYKGEDKAQRFDNSTTNYTFNLEK